MVPPCGEDINQQERNFISHFHHILHTWYFDVRPYIHTRIWVCILMGRRVTRVGVGVCFAGMFRGHVSGMFRGIRSYFTCNFGGMLRGMFRVYVSGYVTGYVSRVCNPCAILKPERPKITQTHICSPGTYEFHAFCLLSTQITNQLNTKSQYTA